MHIHTHLKSTCTCTYPHMNQLVAISLDCICDLLSTDFCLAKGNFKKPYHGPRMTVALYVVIVYIRMNTQAHTPENALVYTHVTIVVGITWSLYTTCHLNNIPYMPMHCDLVCYNGGIAKQSF